MCEAIWCYGAGMSGSTDNIEGVARAICAKVLARDGKSDEKLTAEVDMYWHVVAAEDWQNAAALSVLCTIPDDELPETRRGLASTMFVWRILWPLSRFGLLEYRGPRGDAGRDLAQERPVRPLPVVRCPAFGQPRIGPGRDRRFVVEAS